MSATDATQTPVTAEQKKARVQMIDVLGIFVPPPRVRNYFTKKLSDVEKHFELKQLKKKEDAGTTPAATDAAATDSPAAESTQEIRLSPEANAALAVVSSSLLVDVIKHAMDNALSANMKRVTVAHFLSQKLESLECQSLVAHLPVVKQRLAEALQAAQQQPEAKPAPRARKAKTAAQHAGAEAAAAEAAPATPATAEPATEATPAQSDATDAAKKDPEFMTYVARAFADVKSKDARYADLMLTNDFKVFLSAVLVEFVQSVATLAMVFIEAMDLKTIKHRVVMKVVKSMLALHGRFDVFASYRTVVDEKLKLYESYEHKDAAEQPSTEQPAAEASA